MNARAWFYSQPGFHAPAGIEAPTVPAAPSAVEASLTPAVPARSADLLRAYPVLPAYEGVLERAQADLAASVVDFCGLTASESHDELAFRLHEIAACASRAYELLNELDEQDSLSRSESEVAR